jgi:hypothetical protein
VKKLLIIAAIVAAAVIGFMLVTAKSEAYEVYEEFAEAITYQDFATALERTEPGSQARYEVLARQHRPRFAMMGTYSVVGTSYDLQSEAESGDGTSVDIRADQTVRINGGGQESAFGRPVLHRHTAKVALTGDGWKVVMFHDEIDN